MQKESICNARHNYCSIHWEFNGTLNVILTETIISRDVGHYDMSTDGHPVCNISRDNQIALKF